MLLIMTSKMIFIAWRMKKKEREKRRKNILRESFELLLARLNEQHRENEK